MVDVTRCDFSVILGSSPREIGDSPGAVPWTDTFSTAGLRRIRDVDELPIDRHIQDPAILVLSIKGPEVLSIKSVESEAEVHINGEYVGKIFPGRPEFWSTQTIVFSDRILKREDPNEIRIGGMPIVPSPTSVGDLDRYHNFFIKNVICFFKQPAGEE